MKSMSQTGEMRMDIITRLYSGQKVMLITEVGTVLTSTVKTFTKPGRRGSLFMQAVFSPGDSKGGNKTFPPFFCRSWI